jgi:hypothetical protein
MHVPQTTSYISHVDYLELDDSLPHDYDSAHKGGNRYATILLYMTDLGERDGGETVFTEAWPVGQAEEDHVQFDTVCYFVPHCEPPHLFSTTSTGCLT